MSAVRVKICGLTRVRDVRDALACGADALGFVFAESKRQIDMEKAQRLVGEVAGEAVCVGLFMDQSAVLIEKVLAEVPLDLLQFHGNEDNDFCSGFAMSFIKAVSMDAQNSTQAGGQFPDASGLLLDSHPPDAAGGTGKVFDWKRVPDLGLPPELPIWLAGGLTPGNVAAAVAACWPYAVDVSSGVEQAPGIKNSRLMRDFVRQAKTGAP